MKGVSVAFNSKAPHTTPWLSIEHPVDAVPEDLFSALAQIGWAEDGLRGAPPLDGMQEIILVAPKGSSLFGGWTDEERRRNMPIVREVLRKFGITGVPWYRLSLEDLL